MFKYTLIVSARHQSRKSRMNCLRSYLALLSTHSHILIYPLDPSGKPTITVENHHFSMGKVGKASISMAIFSSKLLDYQRVI